MSALSPEAGAAFDSGANDPAAVFVSHSLVQSHQLRGIRPQGEACQGWRWEGIAARNLLPPD
jgi:hypothetical protein